MTFSQRLRDAQRSANSLLCIGLDTDLEKIPKHLFAYGEPMYEFNRALIDATRDLVCAYKLNLAFYEAAGEQGWLALHRTLAHIPDHLITIGDGKRGDIGNSAEMYAQSLLDDDGFAACTVSPYMGEDSVRPFLKKSNRGVFVLALTSNSGARDFQYLRSKGAPLFEHVVRKVKRWNTKKNCGLVVGATRPRQLRHIRRLVPTMPLLIPGVGTQGGDLKNTVRFGCDRLGEMAVITASRSIIYASQKRDFAERARAEAQALRDQINTYREQFFPPAR
jgi:orotidine-5'-phosphate decarboxylase